MTAFSKTLSGFVNSKKISISSLSSESGIERTLLHKYISGTRTPSDINAACSISDALMLSPQQKKILCDSFRITILGEDGYKTVSESEKILNFLSEIPDPGIYRISEQHETIGSSAVEGRICVDTVIRRIIRSQTSGTITLISPSEYRLPVAELTGACIDRPEISVNHILDFESRNESCRNLKIFSDILPLIVFGRNYIPLINYSHPFSVCHRDSLLPCLVLTQDYAFAFSSRADSGILCTQQEYISVYQSLVSDLCSRSYSLIHKKITSVPEESDVIFKYNDNLFVEDTEKCLSFIYSDNHFFSKILVYEQSLRNTLGKGVRSVLNV